MTTTYLLHGGRVSLQLPSNKAFIHEILTHTPHTPHILRVPFAGHKEHLSLPHTQRKMATHAAGKPFTVSHATPDEQVFLEEIKRADVIYINGGDPKELLPWIVFLAQHLHLLDGKLVVGVSAGANCLATAAYSNTYQQVLPGSGVLPIITICHYTDEFVDAVAEMQAAHPTYRLVALEDGQREKIVM